MAWNEPGGGGNKDPWSNGGGRKGNSGGGPPDLDQLWRRLRDWLKRAGSNRSGGSGGGSGGPSGAVIGGVVVVVIIVWLLSGLYVVQPGEKGVVLRFGAYIYTANPGWHWRIPYPVDRVYKVDTQQIRRASARGVMLTQEENYVEVEVSAQYRVSDAMHYLFKLRHPDQTVELVLQSTVREIVGGSQMNQVIQEGVDVKSLKDETEKKVDLKKKQQSQPNKNSLSELSQNTVQKIKQREHAQPKVTRRSRATLDTNIEKLMQYKLSKYQAGTEIVAVNVQYSQPPEPVQGAFEEAIKAREQKVSKKNKARAFARSIVVRAQGEKAQRLAEAHAYQERKVARAKGQAGRFARLAKQYGKAPDVTRERLYLQTMSDVLAGTHLILKTPDQGSITYLPLQKLLGQDKGSNPGSDETPDSGDDQSNASFPMPDSQASAGANSTSSGGDRSRNRNR